MNIKTILDFGQKVPEYEFKVINEREARASAGIMFLFGIISLFAHFKFHTFFWAELFSITFIVEFFVRVIINPKYSPYMLLGSLIVSNQEPDWVEAKPKQFAWILGSILGLIMAIFIIYEIQSPIRLLTCVLCLILLFTESAFGICLGCIVYKQFNVKLNKCPGGVCETAIKNKINTNKIILLSIFIGLFSITHSVLKNYKYNNDSSQLERTTNPKTIEITKKQSDCQVPQFAIAMGHEEIWKEHHGCK